MDIDATLNTAIEVEMPAIDFDSILEDFKWSYGSDVAALELSLVTELNALEAANVHALVQSESQANEVALLIDKSLTELSEIEKWLKHYTGQLEKMGNDVHQIEAQNKGMQVVAENERKLIDEIESFVKTLKVPGYVTEILENEPLDTPEGVAECYKALQKILGVIRYKNQDLMEMTAVRERISFLQDKSNKFALRICDYMSELINDQAEAYLHDKTRASQRGILKLQGHELLETKLFKYKKLMGWLKDQDARKHSEFQMTYVQKIAKTYKSEIREFLDAMKQQFLSRKLTADEADFLFTSLQGSAVSAAATNVLTKLDWRGKKAKGAANTAHTKEGDSETDSIVQNDEQKMTPDEALGHALLKITTVLVREQNFIMDFFSVVKSAAPVASPDPSASPAVAEEELDIVAWQTMLSQPKQIFKDSKAEKRIQYI